MASQYNDLYNSIENMDPEKAKETISKNKKPKDDDNDIWSEILSYIKIIILAVIIAFLCDTFLIVNAQVPTSSMKSTIMNGDRIIGNRLAYIFSTPQRGDIVIFKFPDDESEKYVKRIIGLPNDIVEIMKDSNGIVHVYINGAMIDEPYINEPMSTTVDYQNYVVPDGHYFMMGDNRNNSLDSRYWDNKYVAKNKILAKALLKYYKDFELLN